MREVLTASDTQVSPLLYIDSLQAAFQLHYASCCSHPDLQVK